MFSSWWVRTEPLKQWNCWPHHLADTTHRATRRLEHSNSGLSCLLLGFWPQSHSDSWATHVVWSMGRDYTWNYDTHVTEHDFQIKPCSPSQVLDGCRRDDLDDYKECKARHHRCYGHEPQCRTTNSMATKAPQGISRCLPHNFGGENRLGVSSFTQPGTSAIHPDSSAYRNGSQFGQWRKPAEKGQPRQSSQCFELFNFLFFLSLGTIMCFFYVFLNMFFVLLRP